MLSRYKCFNCGYLSKIKVSGHEDYLTVVHETRICTFCKELIEVCITSYDRLTEEDIIPELQDEDNPFGTPIGLVREDFEDPSCLWCEKKETIKWDAELKPCPCCNHQMEAIDFYN